MSSFTIPLLINGKETTTSNTFAVHSPGAHKDLWSCSSASASDADAALQAAKAAFPAWSKTKPVARRNILLKAADLLEQHGEEFKEHMSQETGAVAMFTGFNVMIAAELIRDVAGRIGAIMGAIPQTQDDDTTALVLKEPFGVVLGIAPWNAPYILGVRSVLYAIAAGNATVLKGSELSPRCYYNIGRIFTEAGLPAGVLNVLYTTRDDSPAITSQLINSPVIKKVNFTGSTAIGSIIAATAGKALKPCLMELGGKASAIVLDDADIETAATQCALGAFVHSGQVCMSTERILVHKSIIDKFRPALKGFLEHFDAGPAPIVVQGAAIEKNRKLIEDAVTKGAKVVHGDHKSQEKHPETGEISATRLRPIVVEGVKEEMDMYHQESFGPSVSLIEVESEEEAIRIANDTEYGLTSAVFTKDLGRALRIAKQIEAGAVHINSMSIHDEPTLPHGGYKKSGWGRFNAHWGLDEFLQTKTVTFKN
ncbi:putative salicylaldehyde dehydrogenase protein [Lasiodiplodia theobromae]|uniref:Vanillin dehydrogenase n=1 Tax=Lasiodiplodia theobromae TaxID=45133 RepID=A0A5N5D001_9PEZI|nr:Salicylaldehyde dehydrogenase [Lasiodiplodia theobromae]KAB2570907.1 Vanillin dehydrogenase [Lasiodiplodia theobromae]KAF4542062.1 Salicylaldehyde dehydrogenase [Lasiodiplodia theobromae]KAF9635503.1 putative salicylaldehyde dehydrogenase protein [Lasiodiplodia theobromae]